MSLSKSLLLSGFITGLLLLSGCSYLKPYKAPITQGTIIKPEQVSLLQPGLTMDQVQSILGPPFGKDPFNPKQWAYVFYTTDVDLYPDSARFIALTFDSDNYLQEWKINQQTVKLDKDDSFLANIFDD